jgi:hypothetical protein
MTRGKLQGAAKTTSKAMSWPAKPGWLASQYWAALTIRRRYRPGGGVGRLAPLHLDEGEPPALKCHEVDLADRGCVTPRHDAVAFQPEEKRNERLSDEAASIGSDPLGPHGHLRLSLSPSS